MNKKTKLVCFYVLILTVVSASGMDHDDPPSQPSPGYSRFKTPPRQRVKVNGSKVEKKNFQNLVEKHKKNAPVRRKKERDKSSCCP